MNEADISIGLTLGATPFVVEKVVTLYEISPCDRYQGNGPLGLILHVNVQRET